MGNDFEQLIGGAWLSQRYSFEPALPLATTSRIGGRRATQSNDGLSTETYVEAMRPEPTLRGHLTFHLKHEAPNLELLSRLFECCPPDELTAWIDSEPTGQYARRAGFLYEWITGRELPVRAAISGPTIDAMDGEKMVVATAGLALVNKRWRVRDNLPGTRAFCPVIRKAAAVAQAMALDIPALIHALAAEFGEDVLMKSAVWMTLRESKSSFEIEGEADKLDRIQRFADVLSRRTGAGAVPLDEASLAQLQSEILGRSTSLKGFGLRQSPVFVGETIRYQDIVHYVAPASDDVPAMLSGLQIFLTRTQGQSPVMRSAVAAFGFVYIHPLADGNGRVHRFLINDLLRRDGAVHAPMIVPVSAFITHDAAQRHAYDDILDVISKPLMRSVAGGYEFTPTPSTYPDGINSNFVFHKNPAARHVWQYLDLTQHVIYLSHVIERTIREDMREESRYLRSHARARSAIKDIIEMPDAQVDRVIRSMHANEGKLSNALAKEVPALARDDVWERLRELVRSAFEGERVGELVKETVVKKA